MSANNNITLKVQQAVSAYLKSLSAATDLVPAVRICAGLSRGINTEIGDQALQSTPLPRIVVECQAATHLAQKTTGTWQAEFTIIYASDADETLELDHLENAGTILDLLMTDTAAADLSGALEDFTAFEVLAKGQSYDIDSRVWTSRMDFEICCCGSDIE